MSDKINSAELENLIKSKIREKGLANDISDEKIAEIKNSIKKQLQHTEISEAAPVTPAPTTPVVSNPVQQITPAPASITPNAPNAITQTTSVSKDAVDLAKREGELEQREREFAQKQSELTVKEKEIEEKAQALSYKPQIPVVLEGIGNEKLFVFDKNELSLGQEALANVPFRLLSNPDDKKSMIELWTTEAKKGADIYVVHFDKVGEIIFDPFKGTANYVEKPFEDGEQPKEVPADGLTPEQAMASQEPLEPLSDSIPAKTDVTMEPSNDMGLNNVDLEQILKDRIDHLIKDYFLTKFPKV